MKINNDHHSAKPLVLTALPVSPLIKLPYSNKKPILFVVSFSFLPYTLIHKKNRKFSWQLELGGMARGMEYPPQSTPSDISFTQSSCFKFMTDFQASVPLMLSVQRFTALPYK
jgi:hypothetical protein